MNATDQNEQELWYSVKCVFAFDYLAHEEGATVYEERVVVLRAHDFDEAIALGEAEAEQYAVLTESHYCGFIGSYHLAVKRLAHRAEVYSLMRESRLDADDYLNHFYDDGNERSRKVEKTKDRAAED